MIWFGGDRGQVLGPYLPGDLSGRVRAIAWLTQVQGSAGVYRIRAGQYGQARRMLNAELRRERASRARLA